ARADPHFRRIRFPPRRSARPVHALRSRFRRPDRRHARDRRSVLSRTPRLGTRRRLQSRRPRLGRLRPRRSAARRLTAQRRTTVIVRQPEFPAASNALTVILLVPTSSGTLAICQLDVPAAVPALPKALLQRTSVTPMLSEAVPLSAIVAADVEIRLEPGDRIAS